VTELLAALSVILLAVLGTEWHRRRTASLQAQLRVERARRRVTALVAQKAAAAQSSLATAGEITVLDNQIELTRRQILSAHQSTRDLSADDVVRRLRELGY
jgi:hypothetical protein